MHKFQKIEYRRVQAGYWVLVVDGIDRPVVAVRDGRNWTVQGAAMDRKSPTQDTWHGSARRLDEAKSLMNFVWLAMDSQRELTHYEALEQELTNLNARARELRVTYPILPQDTSLARRIALVRALIEDRVRQLNHVTGRVG